MSDNASLNFDNDDSVDPSCMGCDLIIEEGNVVAFGEGIWHVQCVIITEFSLVCKVSSALNVTAWLYTIPTFYCYPTEIQYVKTVRIVATFAGNLY
ncbi:14034_t:CDS:2 [Funneliformis caledonium]|uniref:14034_t:CDS:1 n=1 Tax=Funneliformis caledonium TaxID=1117310 RepID=A0A9N9DUY3_9GLOM|nr:14034_t:CDS:2 [Funneliformis caledonium]